jgi:hypothetical protein
LKSPDPHPESDRIPTKMSNLQAFMATFTCIRICNIGGFGG